MKKQADTVQIDTSSMPSYDPKVILEKAGVDWDSIGSINPDGIAVSQDLADAWREMLGDQFDLVGPKVDPNLPAGTAAVFQDQLEAGGSGAGKSGADAEEGEQDEAAQGAYRVGEEDAGDGESKDMLPGPGEGAPKTGSRVRQRELARHARAKNPRDYHQKPTREYDLMGFWDQEAEVSGSGSSEFLGEPKGKDKKEKKT